MIGNRFWKDFGVGMEAFLGPNWPSEAIWKASVIKYVNEEGPRVRGKQGEPHRPLIPVTGSADFLGFLPRILNLAPSCFTPWILDVQF